MDEKHIKAEYQLSWKTLRDMASNGIGHSNLGKISDSLKEKEKEKNKKEK